VNPYLLPHLPADRPYSWVLTVDPNKRHGGLLTAIDHEENRFYAAEHYAESLPDSKHAESYLQMLAAMKLKPNRDVAIFADPGGAGAQAIINLAEVGLFCTPVPKDAGSVKASIERVRRAAWVDPGHRHPLADDKDLRRSTEWGHLWGLVGAPHCYFVVTLRSRWTLDGVDYDESRLMWELRQYRQKENGKPDEPVKEKDDLVDCMRYLELVRPFAPKAEDTTALRDRAKLDRLSRKANEEFDELVKKAKEPKQTTEVW
jgi:hypothetical protein